MKHSCYSRTELHYNTRMNTEHCKSATFSLLVLLTLGGCSREAPVSYSTDIEPLLHASCLPCHSHERANPAAGGFSVDSYVDVYQGGRSGPVIVHDNPAASSLPKIMLGQDPRFQNDGYHFVSTNAKQRQRIKEWVDQGMYDN